jgi:predicted nucleic acid-binding protein
VRLTDVVFAECRALAIDTAPIIYFIEENSKYISVVEDVFQRIDEGMLTGVTSVISLTEVLTHPFLHGNKELANNYRQLLLEIENFSTLPIDARMAELAAELRVRYSLRVPDALQVACAVVSNCDAFLTNDKSLRRVTEIRVIVLDDLLG